MGWQDPVDGRPPRASLELTGEELRALLAGVTALAEHEVSAARSGPVFAQPPSAAEVDRMVGADRGLPDEGESVDELLAACAAVLAAGRRTTPAFFGYVQSPPAAVGIAGDLLASAADQNLTSGGRARPRPPSSIRRCAGWASSSASTRRRPGSS